MADQFRIKQNTYFAKQNHIALKKSEVNKTYILDAGVQRASGLGFTINDGLAAYVPQTLTDGSISAVTLTDGSISAATLEDAS